MSLRLFHIIFVSVSSFLMIYMAFWSFNQWNHYADNTYLSYLSFSLLGLLSLMIYGQQFLKKYKHLDEH